MFRAGSNGREVGRLLAIAQVGTEMVAPIGLGLALDYFLDWLRWMPWCTIGGAVLGLVAGMAHLIMILKQQDRSQAAKDPQEKP